jgi:flagellar basal body-associated protein FliL
MLRKRIFWIILVAVIVLGGSSYAAYTYWLAPSKTAQFNLGSSYVLQENIGPGATVQFDLRVPYKPYADYQLYAQAERG